MHHFSDENVAAVFHSWPKKLKKETLVLREMIFDVAAQTEAAGPLVETLKWNVPAYLTQKPKTGTTIRLEVQTEQNMYGLFVPCTTTLIEQSREIYPGLFRYDKNRGILFGHDDDIAEKELRHFIAMALTYHVKSGPNIH